MKPKMNSIGKDKAIALFDSGWWKDRPAREVAMFQMFTKELSMPFDVFHKSLEEALGRPVWTHELGLNADGLQKELLGETATPTMDDIINLIPEDKRLVLVI